VLASLCCNWCWVVPVDVAIILCRRPIVGVLLTPSASNNTHSQITTVTPASAHTLARVEIAAEVLRPPASRHTLASLLTCALALPPAATQYEKKRDPMEAGLQAAMRRYLNNTVWMTDFAAAYVKVLGSPLLTWAAHPVKIQGRYSNEDCPRGVAVDCSHCGALTRPLTANISGGFLSVFLLSDLSRAIIAFIIYDWWHGTCRTQLP
jgi:hypothetical protein